LRVLWTANDSYNMRNRHSGLLSLYYVLNIRAESIEPCKMRAESGETEVQLEGPPDVCRRDAGTTERHPYSDRIWMS